MRPSSSKDQSLLVRCNTLLVLELGFHVLYAVRGLNIKSDCLSSECLDEHLHIIMIANLRLLAREKWQSQSFCYKLRHPDVQCIAVGTLLGLIWEVD